MAVLPKVQQASRRLETSGWALVALCATTWRPAEGAWSLREVSGHLWDEGVHDFRRARIGARGTYVRTGDLLASRVAHDLTDLRQVTRLLRPIQEAAQPCGLGYAGSW